MTESHETEDAGVEGIGYKMQRTSVDLIDYRWIRMVQACFKAVSDLFRTCLDWFQTRLKSLRDFYIYIYIYCLLCT